MGRGSLLEALHSTAWQGGALSSWDAAYVALSGCQFLNNSAGWAGGAIFAGSPIDDNALCWLDVSHSLFHMNIANDGGLAVRPVLGSRLVRLA